VKNPTMRVFICGVLLCVCLPAVCGTAPLNTNSESRIIGGQDAPAGSWPWQVSLHIQTTLCGGSLINNQWVLTAAQCFTSNSLSDVRVYLGRDTQEGPNPDEVTRSVSVIIKHSNYDEKTKENDIALLQLSSPVNFTDHIRPVCLAAEQSFFPGGLRCWVTGWGDIQTHGEDPTTELQEVNVPVVSNIKCRGAYPSVTTNMMCAGPNFRGKGFCQKDFGGPLVTLNATRWVQAGVVSFATGCGYPKFPGVYTRVSQYQNWINRHVGAEQPGYITFYSSSTRTFHCVSPLVPLLLSFLSVLSEDV
uniref:Tryptase-like n=1 Tax=Kryptolebias marmoratus TaxID=37003 RepID=A0A3Q3B8Y9_KRYMA